MKRILIATLLLSATAHAQQFPSLNPVNDSPFNTAADFLRICTDARAGGMGDGSIALSNDANAMHWNVSKLAFNPKKYGASVSYVPWMRALLPDINMMYLSGYGKLDSASVIGASVRYFSLGSLYFTNAGGAVLGEYKPRQMAVDVGYSRKLNEHFSAGIALRYIHSSVMFNAAYQMQAQSAYAGDLGMTWRSDAIQRNDRTVYRFTSGFSLTNAGTKLKEEINGVAKFLPTNLGLAQGVEWSFKTKHHFAWQVELNKLLVPTPPVYALDTNGSPIMQNGSYVIEKGKDPNRPVLQGMFGSFSDAPGGAAEEFREVMMSTGIEYAYRKLIKVRAGYFYEHRTKGNRQFATVGCGVAYEGVALDFCYLFPVNGQRSPLENTLRFTLLMNIDQFNIKPRGH